MNFCPYNMKRDIFRAESDRDKSPRGTKRRQLPSEVTSATPTAQGGTSGGCGVEEGFADKGTSVRVHYGQEKDFEFDRMSLTSSFGEADREQEEDSAAMEHHVGAPAQGDVVLWRVDAFGDTNLVKTIQILASVRANNGHIGDIPSPFEDPEILALVPDSSESTVCDSSMDEGVVVSSDEGRASCPVPVRLSNQDDYDSLDVRQMLRGQD